MNKINLKSFNIKKIALAILVILALGVTAFVITMFLPKKEVNPNKMKVNLYFLNPLTNTLEIEERYVDKRDNPEVATEVLRLMYEGPKNKKLSKTLLSNVQLILGQIVAPPDNSIDDISVLDIEFSKEYLLMTPIEEQFFRSALVWTMTDLSFIDQVHIYVDGQELLRTDGQPLGLLSRDNVILNPLVSFGKLETQKAVLYFSDSLSQSLVPEERVIEFPEGFVEKYVVEQLIAGPKVEGLLPTVPGETKVLGVETEEGICYLNLNKDFLNKHTGGAAAERLTVYSIVNSLCQLNNIKRVQFLIESEKINTFKGTFDLSNTVEPNLDIVKK